MRAHQDAGRVSFPPHLIVLGGSYIGLEFAQVYRRFGSEVTVIELAPRLIAREDEDVSDAVAEFLKEEGIDVRVDSKVFGVEKRGNRIAVKVESAGKISEVVGTHALVAIGRRPNTDDLGLEKAGLITDPRGYIQVDDQLRTNVPGIWAMGDCNGRGAFTHTSYNDFEIVAANILDNDQRRVSGGEMNMPKNVDEIRKESMDAAMKSFGAMSKCFQAFAVEPHGRLRKSPWAQNPW
jgi:pyruvate/2-oxoglutarate dehydrogenase complex dihydrolipoamide dehydrogenase (E3) component